MSATARIDWAGGRIVGFAADADSPRAVETVELLLGEDCVLRAVANRSVFDPELAPALIGLDLPAREMSAFELRIPASCLLPSQLGSSGLVLAVRSGDGRMLLSHVLRDSHELLRLTDGAPADLLWQVRFSHVEAGRVLGSVRDLHGCRIRPNLVSRLNEQPAQTLDLFDSPQADGLYDFAVPLSAEPLSEGRNCLQIQSAQGQTLASYPIQLGAILPGEADQRLLALEAELAFLKHLVLNPTVDALPTRLALLKTEIIHICSDMLSLQRTQIEREIAGARPAPASPDA